MVTEQEKWPIPSYSKGRPPPKKTFPWPWVLHPLTLGYRGAKPMAAGNLGRRGWIFQYLPPLGGARIQ